MRTPDKPYQPDKDLGQLALGVRQDEPANLDAQAPLASADGNTGPLTTDKRGRLKAAIPDGLEARAPTLGEKLDEMLSLLRRMVLGMELLTGQDIPDPDQDQE